MAQAHRAILIGNGPNRLIESDRHSWDQLMIELCSTFGVTPPQKGDNDLKPFPIFYEEVVQAAVSSGGTEGDVRKSVAEFASEISPNTVHQSLMNLPFQAVLTTNYDLALERSILGDGSAELRNEAPIQETKHSLFRRLEVNGRSVWHLHGDCRQPGTIALGFDHYSGYLQQVRTYLLQGIKYSRHDVPALRERLERGRVELISWVDLLFTNTVEMVGIGLSFAETHLWWLITYRARLQAISGIPVPGELVYHCMPPKEDDRRSIGRLDALRSQGVRVRCHGTDPDDHQEFYRILLNRLERSF